MKTYNTAYGIFYDRPFFTLNRLEEIAAQALDKAGCTDSDPGEIPIEDVLEECLGLGIDYSPLSEDVMGCAHFEPEGLVKVEIHESLSLCGHDPTLDRRRRSTIAHELGHGLVHTPLYRQRFEFERQQADFDPAQPQHARHACRTTDIREVGHQQNNGNSFCWLEWQANFLMGALLVPRRAIQRHLEHWTGPQDGVRTLRLPFPLRDEAAVSTSAVFHVSRQLAAIRIEGLYPDITPDQPELFAEVSA